MNKKGFVFWAGVIFIAIAFFTFISLTSDELKTMTVTGEWQAEFINSLYLPAEEKQLKNEIEVMHQAHLTIKELAQQGGFIKASKCGKTTVNKWNSPKEECFPDVNGNFAQTIKGKINKNYNNLKFQDGLMLAEGPVDLIKNKLGSYSYSTSLALPMKYSLDEYLLLFSISRELIQKCSVKVPLQSCLNDNKPAKWDYTSCSSPQFSSASKVIPFCVESSTVKGPIYYHFALDFSSDQPQPVLTANLKQESGKIIINFQHSGNKFKVYYTDGTYLKNKKGKVGEIFNQKIDAFGYFWDSKEFTVPICNKETCAVSLNLEDGKIQGEILVGITELKEGKESLIDQLLIVK